MAVSVSLMKVLVCPKCKGNVAEKGMFINCRKCSLSYPVLEKTVPNMLIEDAWKLENAKKAKFNHKLHL